MCFNNLIYEIYYRFSIGIIVEICKQLSSQLVKHNLAIRGIPVVQRAVAKIQTKPEQLVSPHADLAKLCLKVTIRKEGREGTLRCK